MHQQPMVADHGTQYEGNLFSHHGGMCEEGLTDGRTDTFPTFSDSTWAERGIIKVEHRDIHTCTPHKNEF